jgi:hypothetical protein
MKSAVLSAFALSLIFVSCKDDKKTETPAAEAKKETLFSVTVNAVVTKDDTFQVFYNEDGTETWPADQAVTVDVKGSPDAQDIVFQVPDDYTPMALRLDIGANKDQKEVTFKNFKVKYKGKEMNAKGAEIFKYFYPAVQVEFDTVAGVAKIKPIEGQAYDPIMACTQPLKDELNKLYGNK